jgi:3-oxoacyl-[acyl-carrier protein] reductase
VPQRAISAIKADTNAGATDQTGEETMDLGIAGRRAIVCAASKGLGRACAMALARAGVAVTITARTAETLEQTAAEIRTATGAEVTAVAGDITTEAGRAAALAACPEPDILVNNAGGPPHGDFRDWGIEDWQKAVNGNMLTPIMLIKATVDGMCARKFGRIVNITSGSVKSPIPNLGMSNGARAGLTGFVAGLARQVARHNVTINGLLPGPFLTDRLRSGIEFEARRQNISFEEMLARRSATNPAGRVGDPQEFGAACAFLCAASSGFIVGQNLLLDGGAFNSTMG